jgi:hypothetical protein
MKYAIEGQELTDIADALRRRHGETEVVTVEEFVPFKQVVKTPNATGFDSYDGTYYTSSKKFGEATIEGATKTKVTISYDLPENQMLYIDGGSHSSNWAMTENKKKVIGTGKQEFEFDNNTVTFYMDSSDYTYINKLGFYAEVIGLDENGNVIGEIVQVEKEITRTYTSAEMAEAIDAIEVGEFLPEEAFVLSGDCSYRFSNGGWDWFLELYRDRITTKDIGTCSSMFNNAKTIEELPFDFNFKNNTFYDVGSMFNHCNSVKSIGKLINLYPTGVSYMFNNCWNLKYIPEFVNPNWDRIHTYQYAYAGSNLFSSCHSLRKIPESLLGEMYNPMSTSYTYLIFYSGFTNCYTLDEVKGLNPTTGTLTSNAFSATFNYCYRVKDIIFKTQDDGTPYSVKWKSQTIDLSRYNLGYTVNSNAGLNYIIGYNSGITADKEVYDDASYQALKNDPDWWTRNAAYSRYNHDSAVNTINSLPDTSAYLATAGGTNTISFKGAAGSKTDGGAINTLTEEEIAVATAKGWTVTFA